MPGSQSQIPRRDKLSGQASVRNLPLIARGVGLHRTNLAPAPIFDEGEGHFLGTRGSTGRSDTAPPKSVTYSSIKGKGLSSCCAVRRNIQDTTHIFKPTISEEN